MHDVVPFALVVVVAALALLAAVGSSRISEWVRIPAPAIFLVAASVCADAVPRTSARCRSAPTSASSPSRWS